MQYSILLFISFAFSVSGATITHDIDERGLIDFKRVTGVNINIESANKQGKYTEMEDTTTANGEITLEPTTNTTTLMPTTTTTKVPCTDDQYLVGNECLAKMESKIIDTHQMQTNLTSLIDIDTESLTLLYRGTRDGFNAAAFHSKCDGKANTLTIVKSTFGFVFGGYASLAWKSNTYGDWKVDTTAYLFSLTNPLNKPEKWNPKTGSNRDVLHKTSYGPTFGNGYDLAIYDNSNSNKDSYTAPKSYTCPDEINGEKNGGTWYHGDTSYYFQTLEIEVFQVV